MKRLTYEQRKAQAELIGKRVMGTVQGELRIDESSTRTPERDEGEPGRAPDPPARRALAPDLTATARARLAALDATPSGQPSAPDPIVGARQRPEQVSSRRKGARR